MSRKLFDFRCECGETFEKLVYDDVTSYECVACGKPAKRVVSPVRSVLEGITGQFPGAAMKWEKQHRTQ